MRNANATPVPPTATVALLERVRDACFALDTGGRLTYLNGAAAAMLGGGRDAAIGQPVVSLLPPTEGDALGALLRGVIAGGEAGETAVRLVGADRHLMVRAWREGDAVLVVCGGSDAPSGAATDVTTVVRAQEAAERSERQLRLILDGTSAGIILLNREERCEYANPTALAGFGRTQAEVIGQPFAVVVGPAVYALVRPELARAFRGESVQFSVHIPEGSEAARLPIAGHDFIMVYTPEIDEAGAVRGVVVVNTDVTDHVRAEEALRRSEERYRSLVTATASIVWAANSNGMVSSDLGGWEAYTGQTVADYQGYGWLAAVHPGDAPAMRAQWQHSLATRSPLALEFRLRRRDGAYRLVRSRGVPVLAPDGLVGEWVGTIADVHDERQAEAERAIFAARLTALFRAENLGIAWGEGEGVTEANDAFLRITGYDRADVVHGTLNWRTLVPPEDAPRMRRAVADSVAHGWVAPFAQTFVRKDGGQVSVVLGGSCLNPDPFRFLFFVLDDTERANTEAALRDSEERYRLAAAAVAGLLYDYDRVMRRVAYSPGLFDLTGYHPEEAPADADWWMARTHPDDRPQAQAAFAAAMGDPAMPRYSIEYRVRHRDGRDVWVWDRGYFVRDAAGAVIRSVGSAVDVSERVRAEAEMRRLGEDAVRLRDEFLASVSHELRTPLTSLTASLGLLEDSSQPRLHEAEHGLLRNARRNVAHLTRLVDDLVVFNQVKEHRLQLETQPLDLHALVVEVVASMDILLSRKRQTVALALNGLPFVEGDNRRLRQVLVNLLDNAHRHTPVGTAITVRGWADADGVMVLVEDTGEGIPEAQRERIFERSFVGLAITSGTGLGLAIARSLIELHGGTIHIEATADGGAAFVIRLPYAIDAQHD